MEIKLIKAELEDCYKLFYNGILHKRLQNEVVDDTQMLCSEITNMIMHYKRESDKPLIVWYDLTREKIVGRLNLPDEKRELFCIYKVPQHGYFVTYCSRQKIETNKISYKTLESAKQYAETELLPKLIGKEVKTETTTSNELTPQQIEYYNKNYKAISEKLQKDIKRAKALLEGKGGLTQDEENFIKSTEIEHENLKKFDATFNQRNDSMSIGDYYSKKIKVSDLFEDEVIYLMNGFNKFFTKDELAMIKEDVRLVGVMAEFSERIPKDRKENVFNLRNSIISKIDKILSDESPETTQQAKNS